MRKKVRFVHLSPCKFTQKPFVNELYMSWRGAIWEYLNEAQGYK